MLNHTHWHTLLTFPGQAVVPLCTSAPVGSRIGRWLSSVYTLLVAAEYSASVV